MADVWVGGVPVAALAAGVSEPTWSHTWPGGCYEASWSCLGLPKGIASPYLYWGASVQIKVGGWTVWRGILDQPGAGMTDFTAKGLSRMGEDWGALDNTGAVTSTPSTAITQAITDGLPWTYVTGTAPLGIPNSTPENLSKLLDISSLAAGQRWGVDAQGIFFCSADPTTPSYHVSPGDIVMGQADDDYVTHLLGWYYTALAGTPPVPSSPAAVTVADTNAAALYGRKWARVDLTPRGVLTSAQATSILQGMLTLGAARIGFTESLTLHTDQLLDLNGSSAPLPFLTAGFMARGHGFIAPSQSASSTSTKDFIVGKTTYTGGEQTITLDPVDLAPRTLSDVLAVDPLPDLVPA